MRGSLILATARNAGGSRTEVGRNTLTSTTVPTGQVPSGGGRQEPGRSRPEASELTAHQHRAEQEWKRGCEWRQFGTLALSVSREASVNLSLI